MIGLEPNITHANFIEVVNAISSTRSVEELFNYCDARVSYKCGIYHHLPPGGEFGKVGINRFWSTGISKDVLRYIEGKSSRPDPAMKYIFEKGRPYWMSSLLEQSDYNSSKQIYLVNLALEHIGDGLLFPVFGPFQRQGYIFLAFDQPREFFDDIFAWQIQAILQAIHIKYCTLVESLRTQIKLTEREGEVLELITFGKTNPEIAIILGISSNTVSGHVKRIFLKFDATNRVTVALRAMSSNYSEFGVRKMPKDIHSNAV